MAKVKSGTQFGKAVCEHFGLPSWQVLDSVRVSTGRDEVFAVSLTLMLTADDLAGIARHMGAEHQGITIINNTSQPIDPSQVVVRRNSNPGPT